VDIEAIARAAGCALTVVRSDRRENVRLHRGAVERLAQSLL
jgi:hypothetical protein